MNNNSIFDESKSLNAEDMQCLIGIKIEQVKRKLGYWWVLDNQHVNELISVYHFSRSCHGEAALYVSDGIVTRVSARHFVNHYDFMAA